MNKTNAISILSQIFIVLALAGLLALDFDRTIKSYQSAPPVYWGYKCVYTDRDQLQHQTLDEYMETPFTKMGLNGWEMVGYAMNDGINGRVVCFKKQLSAKEARFLKNKIED